MGAGDVVSRFFERSWIDAPARPGKMLGAFCATLVPDVHPYVLMNYAGERRSVLTLAHELGHGLHGALAQDLGLLNARTPLTLAETASVFAETIVFGRLLEQTGTPESRLSLLAESIEAGLADGTDGTGRAGSETVLALARHYSLGEHDTPEKVYRW